MTYFGIRLQSLRKEDGVLQKDLAKAIGVSKQTVSMWENGDRNPTFENVEAVADFFNVNMATFFADPLGDDVLSLARRINSLPPDALQRILGYIDSLLDEQNR